MSGPFDRDDWFEPDSDVLRQIATRCRCPQVGDPARLGDVVALGIEPGEPAGRIVAFVKRREDGTEARGMHKILVRQYRKGDGWFPTGQLRYGALGVAWGPWLAAAQFQESGQ